MSIISSLPLVHIDRDAAWKIAFKVAFRTFSDLYGDVVQNIERSSQLLVQTTNLAEIQEAQDERVKSNQQFEAQDAHRKSLVKDWLSYGPGLDRQQEIRKERCLYPNSTRWVFGTAQSYQWLMALEDTSPIFWLHGIPGAGNAMFIHHFRD